MPTHQPDFRFLSWCSMFLFLWYIWSNMPQDSKAPHRVEGVHPPIHHFLRQPAQQWACSCSSMQVLVRLSTDSSNVFTLLCCTLLQAQELINTEECFTCALLQDSHYPLEQLHDILFLWHAVCCLAGILSVLVVNVPRLPGFLCCTPFHPHSSLRFISTDKDLL